MFQLSLFEKAGLALLLVLALIGAEQAYENHIYKSGVAAESARRDKIDKENKEAADKELARLSALLALAKAELAAARVDLAHQQEELTNAQNRNQSLQADLASGRSRLRAAIRPGTCQAADARGATAGQVDNGSTAVAELDGSVAANLVGLTGEGDSAIRRLNACITSYNALAKAVNLAGEQNTEQEK